MSVFKKAVLVGGDVLILYASLAITLIIRYGLSPLNQQLDAHLLPFSLVFLVWLLVFYLADLYRFRALSTYFLLFKSLALAILISGGVSIVIFYLFGSFFELTPKTNLLIFTGVFLALDYLWRVGALKISASGAEQAIIMGDSSLISETIEYLQKNKQGGYKVAAHFKNLKTENFQEIANLIKEKNIRLLIIQPHLTKDFSTLHLVYQLLPLGVSIINFWDFYEVIFEKIPLEELEETWFIENITTRRPFYDSVKRILDIILGTIAAILFLPIVILIALIIKITSHGPVIYKQDRVGLNGGVFTLRKFRTMKHKSDGPLWTEKNDQRLTAFGKILRISHLDEIPQLINILRGNISFTGPRPERIELAKEFSKFPHYEMRHAVKPGLTGWAQISFKPSASLEEAYEKLRYDIYYVKNRSLFLDLLIILKTIKYLFTSR